MGNRIYVGNLPWSVDKAQLEELFSSYGDIEEALVVANKYTGRSRGFGFVTFKTEKEAEKAISEMDGKEVEGRQLTVNEARPLRKGIDASPEKAEETASEAGKGKKEGEAKKEEKAKKPKEEKKEKSKEKPKKQEKAEPKKEEKEAEKPGKSEEPKKVEKAKESKEESKDEKEEKKE